jgi:hypothetical protein
LSNLLAIGFVEEVTRWGICNLPVSEASENSAVRAAIAYVEPFDLRVVRVQPKTYANVRMLGFTLDAA